MGYLHNHLATVIMVVFSAILTGLWPVFIDFAPVLNFIFLMAVPISWFIAFMCWIVQKGTDYSHKYVAENKEKKNYSNTQTITQKYTSEGKLATSSEVSSAKTQLRSELDELRDTVKIKESEIEHLKQQIANLKTQVEIESIKTEIANLKALKLKQSKRKTKKK